MNEHIECQCEKCRMKVITVPGPLPEGITLRDFLATAYVMMLYPGLAEWGEAYRFADERYDAMLEARDKIDD